MSTNSFLLGLAFIVGVLNVQVDQRVPSPWQNEVVVWPTAFEGREMRRQPLSEKERAFAGAFPGAIGVFDCEGDQVILRQVVRATRKLHRTATCLRAAGFQILNEHMESREGTSWMCYEAVGRGSRYFVREHIIRSSGGEVWTDVSAWFWDATIHPGEGPWLAISVISTVAEGRPEAAE
jgi:hypothetical protein